VSDRADIIDHTFARLGVPRDEAVIYRYLLGKPPQAVLAVSRGLHIPRTRVYRLMDKLIARGLATQEVGEQGIRFAPADYRALELLLAERETELSSLKANFPSFLSQLSATAGTQAGKASIAYHTGLAGLKHVTWNSLDAAGDLFIIEKSDMTAFVDREFAEDMRREIARRQIMVWQLTTMPHYPEWTDVPECLDWWKLRYIDPKELPVICEQLVYNDVYALYNWTDSEAFAVEIRNADVAAMQKRLFLYLFNHAAPMKLVGTRGEAVVAE
jgi:predicted DNA-binding transcriptional regulator